jgi:hypothetical protein
VQARQLVQAVAAFKLGQGDSGHAVSTGAYLRGTNTAERRGPNRAKNVVRPSFNAAAIKPATAGEAPVAQATTSKTGTDNWESF